MSLNLEEAGADVQARVEHWGRIPPSGSFAVGLAARATSPAPLLSTANVTERIIYQSSQTPGCEHRTTEKHIIFRAHV